MAKILSTGFAGSRKTFNPPPSPPGFEWPGVPDKAQRAHFVAWIKTKLDTEDMLINEFARELYGSTKVGKGGEKPTRGASVATWINGKNFPREEAARVLGCYWETSLADMLGPKSNGHGHHGEMHEGANMAKGGKRGALPPVPRLELPSGAKLPAVKIETYTEDPRFVTFSIAEGLLQLDVALAVMALVQPPAH